ncbi:ABC transporter ATP-binding protein [Marasmitruncus massiliensis]|uniref:ABC transporter ATP-binding protein n=1 Tax=Marasmitruncus massiliensis TaxID=1944642 RepID=UPI001FA8C6B0|nr:ABC transporter ATP-binding protein [Marasmitruncus massiliensis]
MEQSGNLDNSKMSCRNLTKSFPSKKQNFLILDGISFDVRENEFLVLFGPGQCGKTTLLYMLAGIEPPTSGEIRHGGKQVLEPDSSRAVVYQTMALFSWLTVKGNVEFGPKARGVSKERRERDTQHFIDLVGLTGFENSYPIQLSGGMKQRVGIARAYCNNPDVLLMDEPFGHLDAQTRYMMQESLEKIWQNEKRTVVFVTNNIEEAIFLADRIILLSNCPSRICAEYDIALPRPRSVMDPEFLRLRKEITAAMDRVVDKEGGQP